MTSSVASPLAMKINTAIAVVGASRRGAAIFLLKALLAGPSLDQRAIHGKMLVRQQTCYTCFFDHRLEEQAANLCLQHAIPILTEHGRVPHHIIHIQTHKPTEQQVVIQLLHQLSLAADRVERLQQQRAQQLLRRHRRAPEVDIQRPEARRELLQRIIGDATNRAQGMVLRDAVLQRDVAEHRSRLLVGSTHRAAPFVSGSMVVRGDHDVDPLFVTFSAAC